MRLTEESVARPLFTTMVVLIVVILGAVSLSRLPIDLMPDVTYPTLTVSTSYGDVSPEEIEQLITRHVEEAVAAIPGVERISSMSSEGNSTVRVTFAWGMDLDAAAADIRDSLDRIVNDLPEDAGRPQLRKFDVSQFPIVILGAIGPDDPVEMRLLIDNQVRQRIERIPGVAAVNRWGGLNREIQVNVDQDKMRALGLTLDDAVQAVRAANVNVPAGSIERDQFEITLRTPGEFASVDELRNTVVDLRDGAPIYLSQVANVEDTHARWARYIRINDEPGVRLAIRKQPDRNTVQVARAVQREVERINRDIPQITLVPMVDTSQFIERSINNVSRSVIFGGSLAVLMLLFFLRSIRSTLVIAVAIPISVIGTFSLIYLAGFTLNLMTLGGLALGVGMMVDSSIVVLENIYRLREQGLGMREAAVKGAQQVTPAIVASTITTLIIFLPLIFLQGVSGVMFQQLGYVVSFALVCALFVALTLVPMLSARLLTKAHQGVEGTTAGWGRRAYIASGQIFEATEQRYRRLLDAALKRRLVWLGGIAVAFASCLLLLPQIGSEFMPSTDEGEVRITAEMEVGTRLDVVDRQSRRIEAILRREVPEIEHMVVSVGAGSSTWRPGATITSDITLTLAPAAQRTRTSEQIATDLQPALAHIPGTQVRARPGQGLFVLRAGAGDDADNLEIEVRGWDLNILDELGTEVVRRIAVVDGLTDVQFTREEGVPQELFRIDRARAADLNLSVDQIGRVLEAAIGGVNAGDFRDGGDEHQIRVRLANAEHMAMHELLDLTLANGRGEQIILGNVVTTQSTRGPTVIDRRDQQRIASVTAGVTGRDLGSIVADVQEQLRGLPLPPDYEVVIAGDYEEQQRAFYELLFALLLALLLVYMVLVCLYESLRDPLVVMFTVPMAAIGVVVMLLLTGTTFNVQTFIGCIMLAGIVVNNAILIVDQATRLHSEGMSPREAVREAGRRRFRPILMTSLTTALALSPLALGWGEGAEAQAPMARAVIGGLLSASIITLVLIPVVYTLVHREARPA
ncbi:efflux RND transporter permease subunit [Phycisphaerales bacterium AB-hyl4]|uniref:Efflux RND transporter permease subunit n=1 Tax=Natronomicrosphaera hydrolytica TaxID=3242702 RepID=A0ABV4UB26_9BACT